MSRIRVLLVDDHQLFREGLGSILAQQVDFEVVGESADGLEAIIKARELAPDLILMDVTMPGCGGLEATRVIKQESPETTIVMLTVCDDDENLFEAIRSGAQGYILKSIRAGEMLQMLRGSVRGEAAITPSLGGRMLEEFRRVSMRVQGDPAEPAQALTNRERDVLAQVAAGKTNTEIAAALCVSIHTVKTHMRNILAKLQAERRIDAAALALRKGLIPPAE